MTDRSPHETPAGRGLRLTVRLRRLLANIAGAWKAGGAGGVRRYAADAWAVRRLNAYELWARRHRVWELDAAGTAGDPGAVSRLCVVVIAEETGMAEAARTIRSTGRGGADIRIVTARAPWWRRLGVRARAGHRVRWVRALPGEPAHAQLNRAAKDSAAEYVLFVEAGDRLAPNALREIANTCAAQQPDLLYTDEDEWGADGHCARPHFKTDPGPDLMLSGDYMGGVLALRRALFETLGGFRRAFGDAGQYDLVLRATEATDRICHLPRPLYHRRVQETATPRRRHEAMRSAIEDALVRRKIEATVGDGREPCRFRVRRRLRGRPLVSIVVPFRDHPELLRACLGSVLEKSTYDRFEVLGVSNHTTVPAAFDCMDELMRRDHRVRFAECNIEFNFSRLVNFGVSQAQGEFVVLLNNDVEIIAPEWLAALLEHAQRPEAGAVGGKLYFPDDTVQHAGIALGLGGYAGYPHRHFPRASDGYFGRLWAIQNVSAVTAAMMMVRRRVWEDAAGFDEERFAIAYNDVDFCLRLRERGLLNVFTPYAEAYHRESASRGYEETAEQRGRFRREQQNLMERHGAAIAAGDPYYNPNLDRNRDDFAWAP